MSKLREKWSEFVELLKLEHSLFALPFALVGTFMAAGGLPSFRVFILVVLCMVCARTAGMAFNRVLDARYDRDNPRTADRAVAAGRVSAFSVWTLGWVSLAGLSFFAYLLNDLAFYLSFFCHIILVAYSLMKRFTWFCHIFLGFVEAFAPMGGWIAVTGSLAHPTPWLLGLATLLWIGGMDVVYATQDADFDRERGLHSIPSRFGKERSFSIARFLHLLTFITLALVGYLHGSGWVYGVGLVLVGGLFIYQHILVSPTRSERLDFAFFNINVRISALVMGMALLDAWVP